PRPSSPAPSHPPSPGEEGEQQEESVVKAPSLPVRWAGRGRERGGWGSEGSPGEVGREGAGEEGRGGEGRAGERSFGEGLALRWLPIAAPNAYGNSRFIHYWGLSNTNEDASGFVGTATLLAALMAVGARRRFPQEGLALGIAALCLLLLAPLPVTSSRRLLLPLSLCLAYLGACTLERFRLGEI